MNIHILTIGDEILIGQVIDTNSAWMARQLNLRGAAVTGITSVGDDLPAILAALRQAWSEADVVLMTGGLGPTKDDITKKALSEYFATPLVFHQPTYDRIVRIFERLGRKASAAHRYQAYHPETAELLTNRMGTAPAIWMERDGKVLVAMPGVPYEMKHLMEDEIIPRLRRRFPGRPIAHRTVLTVGEGESRIADRLATFEDGLPENVKLAYLPNLGQVRLRLTGRGDDEAALQHLLDLKVKELTAHIPDLVFGFGQEQLEEVIGRMLRVRRLTLGTAESCTGGYIAHRLTTIPGSSDYFQGGIVAYSNALKERLLGVRPETLQQHGAVSRETVIEMVQGAVRALGVDVAVSISGIAGPGGGTPEKPVGTIWMAVGNEAVVVPQKLQAGKDRTNNIKYAGVHALNLVRQFMLEQYKV